jgi:hypothetical protein
LGTSNAADLAKAWWRTTMFFNTKKKNVNEFAQLLG